MSRYIARSTVLGLALSVALAGVAAAENERGTPFNQERQQKLLERFGDQGIDANGDGALTKDEIRAFFADKHGGCPMMEKGKRGDGPGRAGRPQRMHQAIWMLEFIESPTAPASFTAAVFPRADLDGDGQLNDEEWNAFASQQRTQILARLAKSAPGLDADDDGTINATELAAFKSEGRARFQAQILQQQADADADGDGSLSDTEFDALRARRLEAHRAAVLEHFPKADVDGDGSLSDGELYAFQLKQGQRGHREQGPSPRHGMHDRDGRHGEQGKGACKNRGDE